MAPVGTRTDWLGLVRGPRYRHFRGDTQGHLCLCGTLGLEGVQAVVALGDDSPYLRNGNTHIHNGRPSKVLAMVNMSRLKLA